jgi:hypothetical protein
MDLSRRAIFHGADALGRVAVSALTTCRKVANVLSMRPNVPQRHSGLLLATHLRGRCAAVVALWFLAAGGAAADVPPSSAPPEEASTQETKGSLKTITVEAKRERDVIERQVKTFVSAIAVVPFEESLARWRTPICPLVAGLPPDHGEFILTRVSQIARAAGAPLAPEHCRANLYIVVTADPSALLKAWSTRETRMFGDAGFMKIRGFVNATSPIRVWYNADLDAADGVPLTADSAALSQSGNSAGSQSAFAGIPNNTHASGFRLAHDEVRDLSSVIVMVDSRGARGISFGQLADYVALAGLAQLRLGANVGTAPTILHLFTDSGNSASPGLSPWDEAFLKALYHTEQSDKMQLSEIKLSILQDVAP